MKRKTPILSALIAFAILIQGALLADTVDTTSGRGYRGKIDVSQMNANSVTINTSGGPQKIPSHTIKRLTFDGEPNGLRSARQSFLDGQYNRVEEQLDRVKPDSALQALEKEFLTAMAGAKLALRGESGKSIADSRKLVEKFIQGPNNNKWYQFFLALEIYGDLLVASNDLPGAVAQYQKLQLSAADEIKLLGKFKVANVQVLQGKFGDARTAFAEVQKNPADNPEAVRMKLLAKIGEARCLAETGDPKTAIQSILEIIKNEDPSDMILFGHAYNALGNCYAKDGQTKAALLAFLHTDVLYQRDAEIHAEALYHLVKLWKSDQKPGQSLEARKLLTTKYRNTYWGSKAQAERL